MRASALSIELGGQTQTPLLVQMQGGVLIDLLMVGCASANVHVEGSPNRPRGKKPDRAHVDALACGDLAEGIAAVTAALQNQRCIGREVDGHIEDGFGSGVSKF